MTDADADTVGAAGDVFERARPRLTGRAYRILGTLADADDVVQDAWLRWERADRDEIVNADAWLNTTVSRLALDRLRARKREQERYVGPWLPAPLVERVADPAELAELTDSMTTAFLLMLERLTPDERAAFLLADVFGERFTDVAATLDRTPESCRQLASRARRKLREGHAERRDEARAASDVARRFLVALAAGDERAAIECLAPDAVYLGDGGPDRRAARRPVTGPERIVRFLINLQNRLLEYGQFAPALVGGLPGVAIDLGGELYAVTGLEVVDGRVVRITNQLNPSKLRGVQRPRSEIE